MLSARRSRRVTPDEKNAPIFGAFFCSRSRANSVLIGLTERVDVHALCIAQEG